MTDGLSQLAARGRRTREIPPPRNPARNAPVHLTPAAPEPTSDASSANREDVTPAPQPVAAAQAVGKDVEVASAPSQRRRQAAGSPAPRAKSDLKVVTVYLEQDDDSFLETITHTGRTSQPKTAISRSAVVRLALERLHAQMTPEQIVDELRPRGDNSGTGRKRR